jgi:DNA primase
VAISDDKVQQIRDRVDIVELVARYVDLRAAGTNYKGLCPFHREKTPSFNVNPQRKGFKCFGCGVGGDAIAFVMQIEGKGFVEALRQLAELVGVELPADSRGQSEASAKDRAFAAMRVATEVYERLLADDDIGTAARAYLQRRGISRESAVRFRLGYAPAPSEAGWDKLARALAEAGACVDTAKTLGLLGQSERTANFYDRFRGRLMFPIMTAGGDPVAFSGRIIAPHDEVDAQDRAVPKYLNSPESPLFHKGNVLFGLSLARPTIRERKRAILVEGNIDVVKLHQWDYTETVAPLGTALTSEQARLLARFAHEVILCFDGDDAGRKAAWKAVPLLLEEDIDAKLVILPDGEDPDSVGAERLAALIDNAKPALEEMMTRIAARAGDSAQARARGLDRVLPLIARAPRGSARDLYADRAASLFGVDLKRIRSAVMALRTHQRSASRPELESQENSRHIRSISKPVVQNSAPRTVAPLPVSQAQLAMLIVDVPHLATLAQQSGVLERLSDPRLATIVRAVLEGAERGLTPNMPDLLDLVDPPSQSVVHEAVFGGRYRENVHNPDQVLRTLLQRCDEESLNREIRDLDERIKTAQSEGFLDQASALAQKRLNLRRRQAHLVQASQLDVGTLAPDEPHEPKVSPAISPLAASPPTKPGSPVAQ